MIYFVYKPKIILIILNLAGIFIENNNFQTPGICCRYKTYTNSFFVFLIEQKLAPNLSYQVILADIL